MSNFWGHLGFFWGQNIYFFFTYWSISTKNLYKRKFKFGKKNLSFIVCEEYCSVNTGARSTHSGTDQLVKPNLNTLWVITNSVSFSSSSRRCLQLLSNSLPNSFKYARRIGRASSGCMLVYIEVASEVKSRAEGGSESKESISFSNVVEFIV